MEDIAMPEVLDPKRPRLEGELGVDTVTERAHDLARALDQASDYGQYLWTQLAAVRRYLLDTLPDPTADDEGARTLTAPRGPWDDAGWNTWRTAYEAVTAALAGPGRDCRWGVHEAAVEAQRRRGPVAASRPTAALVQIAAERRVRVGRPPVSSDPDDTGVDSRGSGPDDRTPKTRGRRQAVVAVCVSALAGTAAGVAVSPHLRRPSRRADQ